MNHEQYIEQWEVIPSFSDWILMDKDSEHNFLYTYSICSYTPG